MLQRVVQRVGGSLRVRSWAMPAGRLDLHARRGLLPRHLFGGHGRCQRVHGRVYRRWAKLHAGGRLLQPLLQRLAGDLRLCAALLQACLGPMCREHRVLLRAVPRRGVWEQLSIAMRRAGKRRKTVAQSAFSGPMSQMMRALNAHMDFAVNANAVIYLENHHHSGVAQVAGGRASWFRTQPCAIALFTSPGCFSARTCRSATRGALAWRPECDRGRS
jgi:hypothetical protein